MSQKRNTTRTPRGVAIYPHLNTPDTKFDAAGKFHAKIALDADDPAVQAFREELEKLRDEKYQEVYDALVAEKKAARAKELKKLDVFKVEMDDETGEETGRVIISVGMKHKITSKKDGKTFFLKPDYFDGKGVQLRNPPRISGGSIIRCNVEPSAYLKETDKTIGVTLRLNAVQIIKIVSGGARDPGFGVEDDADDIADGEDTTREAAVSGGAATDEDDDL